MIDEAQAAARIFGGSMKSEQAPAPKATPQGQTAADRIFSGPKNDYVSPYPPDHQQQQQQQPAQESKAAEQPKAEQQQPEDIARAASEIANTLAEKAGLDAAHEDTTGFSTLAAEIGISPDGAAKLAAWDAARTEAQWSKQFEAWNEATYSEFLTSDIEAARNLVMEHGDDELHELLTGPYGLGSHPALVRFCRNVARDRRGGR